MSISILNNKLCVLVTSMTIALSISTSADAIVGGAARVMATKFSAPVVRAVSSIPKTPVISAPIVRAPVVSAPAIKPHVFKPAKITTPAYKPAVRSFVPKARNPIPAIKVTAARSWKANFNRGQAQTAIAKQVPKPKPINLSPKGTLGSQFSKVNNPGVIYERYNPLTKKFYLGRAKSTAHYLKRQYAHNRKVIKTLKNKGDSNAANFKHDFHVIGTQHLARGKNAQNLLRVKEESAIRFYKTRTKLKKLIENKRFEMNQIAYSKAGGRLAKPAK